MDHEHRLVMPRPRLVIAGTHSGVGKTTVTLALMAALKARGLVVQPFKAGPDFIDPGHHQLVTGRSSRNLDGWMLNEAVNRSIFSQASADADLSIIEGMMGLFDGSSPIHEQGSTAELAKQLHAPVLLVIDGSAMARSAAAMAAGYARFDPGLSVQGVVFNRVRSEGHYRLLREAVEAEAGLAPFRWMNNRSPKWSSKRTWLWHVSIRESATMENPVRSARISHARWVMSVRLSAAYRSHQAASSR